MLRVDVTKHLGEFSLQASFTSEGRVTGLFGASGAGKTSLINMIAGLLRPDRGIITLDDETLDDERKAEIRPYLIRLRDEANVPMVYVSHDPAELRQLATQIVMLRDGRVTALGGVKVLA